jgi:hypothetical protein
VSLALAVNAGVTLNLTKRTVGTGAEGRSSARTRRTAAQGVGELDGEVGGSHARGGAMEGGGGHTQAGGGRAPAGGGCSRVRRKSEGGHTIRFSSTQWQLL